MEIDRRVPSTPALPFVVPPPDRLWRTSDSDVGPEPLLERLVHREGLRYGICEGVKVGFILEESRHVFPPAHCRGVSSLCWPAPGAPAVLRRSRAQLSSPRRTLASSTAWRWGGRERDVRHVCDLWEVACESVVDLLGGAAAGLGD